jgi:uncharacterized cupin superfamily protein
VSAVSIATPNFDEVREHPGYNCRRARLGRQAGSEKLSMSLFELPAGEAAYPFHYHLAEDGAHQIVNRTEETVRFLAISNQQPDIIVRPDSESVSVAERRPEGGGFSQHFRLADGAGYFDFIGEDVK